MLRETPLGAERPTKEILLANIHEAEAKVKRYREFHDVLLSATDELEAQKEELDRTWCKKIERLSQQLSSCVDECTELTDQIHTVKFLHGVDQEEWSAQTMELQAVFRETQERLSAEKDQLEGEIKTLKDFEKRKYHIQREYASLQKEMIVLEELHAEEIKKLEKKYLLDKVKLKKNAISDIRNVAKDFRDHVSARVPESTQRAISNSNRLENEIAKMSTAEADLQREVDSSKKSIRNMAMRNDELERQQNSLIQTRVAAKEVDKQVSQKMEDLQQERQILQKLLAAVIKHQRGKEEKEQELIQLKAESQMLEKHVAQAQNDADILSTQRHHLLLAIGKRTQLIFRLASHIKTILLRSSTNQSEASETSLVDPSFLQSLLNCFEEKAEGDRMNMVDFSKEEAAEESKVIFYLLENFQKNPPTKDAEFKSSPSDNSYWGKFSHRNSNWSRVLENVKVCLKELVGSIEHKGSSTKDQVNPGDPANPQTTVDQTRNATPEDLPITLHL